MIVGDSNFVDRINPDSRGRLSLKKWVEPGASYLVVQVGNDIELQKVTP